MGNASGYVAIGKWGMHRFKGKPSEEAARKATVVFGDGHQRPLQSRRPLLRQVRTKKSRHKMRPERMLRWVKSR